MDEQRADLRLQRQRESGRCRLIINADDFGWSPGVNRAVAELYDAGAITSASLMVSGPAVAEAVELARARPGLAVGLHVSVADAPTVLPREQVRLIIDERGWTHRDPVMAGLRYTVHPAARGQMEREVAAQFARFDSHGLEWSHVDTHIHMGLTPAVESAALAESRRYPVTGWRVPEDDWRAYRRYDPADAHKKWLHGRWFSHQSRTQRVRVRSIASGSGRPLTTTDRCYGFFRSGRLDVEYLIHLVQNLPDGDLELHCHPDIQTEQGRRELNALLHPRMRQECLKRGVEQVTYRQLADAASQR